MLLDKVGAEDRPDEYVTYRFNSASDLISPQFTREKYSVDDYRLLETSLIGSHVEVCTALESIN